MHACRERREPSPWRERPVEESLKLFHDMKRGLIEEGAATLRCDSSHGQPAHYPLSLIGRP
jgi:glutaminyl-tRNA synthetase